MDDPGRGTSTFDGGLSLAWAPAEDPGPDSRLHPVPATHHSRSDRTAGKPAPAVANVAPERDRAQ
ncbi:hypothetical protein ACPA9J_33160 [Pseudomonas aeruginosa]